MEKIYFVTTSKKKVDELSYFLGVKLVQMDTEIVEVQGTDEEIAIDKLYKACKLNEDNYTIIDDCSLEIMNLKYLPGPYFKDFIKMGLEKLDLLCEAIGRKAHANCILGFGKYSKGEFTYKLFSSSIKGRICKYNGDQECFDDMFVPDVTDIAYSEMPLEECKKFHHRGFASQQLKNYLETLEIKSIINK